LVVTEIFDAALAAVASENEQYAKDEENAGNKHQNLGGIKTAANVRFQHGYPSEYPTPGLF
jgi:hypothetical protein